MDGDNRTDKEIRAGIFARHWKAAEKAGGECPCDWCDRIRRMRRSAALFESNGESFVAEHMNADADAMEEFIQTGEMPTDPEQN